MSKITKTVSWKKTLKTIHQLSCFVEHPVFINDKSCKPNSHIVIILKYKNLFKDDLFLD